MAEPDNGPRKIVSTRRFWVLILFGVLLIAGGTSRWLRRRPPFKPADIANLAFYHDADAKLPPPATKDVRVVFLGDSITFIWGDKQNSSYFTRNPYINRGINTQTTAQLLLRFRQDVIDLQPKVVIILAGTNDLASFKVPDLLAFTEANLESMVDLARANGIRPVLCSVLPVTDAIQVQTKFHQPDKILTLDTWMKAYTAKNHIPYVDYYSAVVDTKGFFRTDLAVDGLHPNAAGFAVMQPLAEKGIAEALAQKN